MAHRSTTARSNADRSCVDWSKTRRGQRRFQPASHSATPPPRFRCRRLGLDGAARSAVDDVGQSGPHSAGSPAAGRVDRRDRQQRRPPHLGKHRPEPPAALAGRLRRRHLDPRRGGSTERTRRWSTTFGISSSAPPDRAASTWSRSTSSESASSKRRAAGTDPSRRIGRRSERPATGRGHPLPVAPPGTSVTP